MNGVRAAMRSAAERLGPRARALVPAARPATVLYALYTLALFLLFLVATFPHEALLRRLLTEVVRPPLAVEATGVHLGWSLAATVDELRLTTRDQAPAPALLAAEGVRVAPSLLGLLRGSPYPLGVRARLYGGTFAGTADPRPAALALDATLARVDLGRWNGLARLSAGTVGGQLAAALALRGDARRPATLDGTATVRATALALEGVQIRGITLPALHFARAELAATIGGGRVELGELVADGTELGVRGGGHVLLRDPLPASLLDLELTLTPAAGTPKALRLMLNLLPGTPAADGARTIRITGAVRDPQVR